MPTGASCNAGDTYHSNVPVSYPCLTAAPQTGTSTIPDCSLPDVAVPGVNGGTATSYQYPDGSGTLRLTTDATSRVGAVFYSTSFPTTSGLDLSFDSYQWGTQEAQLAADGIGFALVAANPAAPQPPSSPGPAGGDLGYSSDYEGYATSSHLVANNHNQGGSCNGTSGNGAACANSGLPNGYLGFGLDVFGNFANPDYQGNGCSDTALGLSPQTQYYNQISVKGPGEGTTGYCLLDSTQEEYHQTNTGPGTCTAITGGSTTTGGLNSTGTIISPAGFGGQTAAASTTGNDCSTLELDNETQFNDLPASQPSPVVTEVLVNTSNAAESMTQTGCTSESVPAYSFGICTIPINANGSTQSGTPAVVFIADALPNATSTIGASNPSWLYTSGAGVPSQLVGVPKQLEFGWTASTGTDVELHDINQFKASTSNGEIPVYTLTNTDSAGASSVTSTTGSVTQGAHPTYTLTPALQQDGTDANETQSATLTDTFPSGVNLSNAIVQSATDSAGNSWSCGITGQVLTCTISPSTEPGSAFTAGNALPVVKIYNATVTPSTGTLTSDAEISSGDGLPATANESDTASTGAPTTTTVSNVPTSPAHVGQPVTYTATVAPTSGTPTSVDGGTVNFSINGTVITGCTGVAITTTAGVSTATCPTAQTYTSPGGPEPTVTATYTGDTLYSGSVGTDAVNVIQTPTTTTVAPSPTPAFGTPITYTATVAPSSLTPSAGTTVTAGSTVAFTNNGTPISGCTAVPIVNSGGVSTATCSTTVTYSNASQENPIVATYAGNSNYTTSNGTYTPAISTPTTTVVSPSPTPAFGTPITYSAVVTPSGGGTVTAGSTVAFTNNGTPISGCSAVAIVNSGGVSTATCTTTVTYASTTDEHAIVATYAGNPSYTTSNGTYTPSIPLIGTTTTVLPSPTPAYGTPVTYTATIVPASGGTTVTAGSTVAFTNNGTPISGCSAVPVVNSGSPAVSTATCTTPVTYSTSSDEHQVVATYAGNTTYSTSNGNYTPAIPLIGTTTVVAPSPTPAFGTPITYTATVTPASGGTTVDGSTVAFTNNGAPISGCSAVPVVNSGSPAASTATCTTTVTYASTSDEHQIVATYAADALYATSNGNYTPSIPLIGTTTTVAPSPTPAFGTPVTYTATVVPASGGTTVTAGSTVAFTNNGTTISGCSAVPVVNSGSPAVSTATCSTTVTYASTSDVHPIVATYAGNTTYSTSNGNYAPSIPLIPTTTVVAPSPTPAFGTPVTYTATVTPGSGGTTVTAGSTVAFTNNGTTISGCSAVPVVNSGSPAVSTATCSTTVTYATSADEHQVVASYAGNTTYGTSTGAYTPAIASSVIPTTTTVAPSPTPAFGTPITYTATVTPASGGTTVTAGSTVAFTNNGSPISGCSAVAIVNSGSPAVSTATCTTTVTYATSSDEHPVVASYAGNSTYGTSNGSYTPSIPAVVAPRTPETLVATATPSTAPVGTPVVLTATGLPTAATGTITFTSGGSTLCSYTLGSASSCATSGNLPAGTYPVTASYSGDPVYAPETATTTFTLTPATPAVTDGGKTWTDSYTGQLPTPTGSGPFTYTVTSQPPVKDGYCSVSSTGVITFIRAAGFSGTVSCQYTVAGPTGKVVETGAYKVVAEPMVGGTIASTPENVPITVSIPRATGTGPLTYILQSGPPSVDGHYVFGADGVVTFDPAPGFTGSVSFTYVVKDAHGNISKPAVTMINVGSSGIAIPSAHTGEPWSGTAYWIAVTSFAVAGAGMVISRVRRVRA
jgi:hypothetical protein